MNKLVLLCLLFSASTVFAEEFYTAGESYQGQPIACLTEKDASDLAEAYVHEGLEELNNVLVQKSAKNLCVAGVPVTFTVIRSVSTHKDKETVYVIEIMSNGIYYIVDPHPVATRNHRKVIPV
ncbi:MAG: hypothetical protein A2937_02585 [Candidatus Yonathbacteria bacterium RIFCSPLOWO2_01_FULL_47_33b]|uniref:PepSY domain-containing protein n=1 Tax=Candidatus Yonathbacteria bacterium RIFCSPLOWO2_01_FULL_47_33b TaxID=1802727 RepID=A0A1G2SG55_9BACT|nr:MAG: hypothetical protein A2937_02585 [Candidatus Yonathbacteria bacterium RIFCSPLOWO2_01_FULL_47_33b]